MTGNTLPIGHDGGFESHISLDVAIAPDGTPFVVYNNFNDQKKLYVMHLDPATAQWSASQLLAEGASDVNIAFDTAGTGYITYTDESNQIHLFKYADADPSGITAVKATKADDRIFNLQGMRVSKAGKGLFIINGKKVIK